MLCAHDLAWFAEFTAPKTVYSATFGNLIASVEHVGSTAVPDLLAKPTLDIDIVMRDYSVFDEIVAGLGRLGYLHKGDQGIYQHEAFKPDSPVAERAVSQREVDSWPRDSTQVARTWFKPCLNLST
jgi:GrpB-like predicted nucleotidyltransferase (UPF0157 family)